MKPEYVNCFIFGCNYDNESQESVLLILKNRPVYLAGQFNGIGGRIEEGETPLEAAHREVFEESGLTGVNLVKFCTLDREQNVIYFFHGCLNHKDLAKYEEKTDEQLYILQPDRLVNVYPNLEWLIPMARQHLSGEVKYTLVITEIPDAEEEG